MNCRFCKTELNAVFIDLFNSPASNSFLNGDQLNEPETYYPLKVYTCTSCFLVQIDEYKKTSEIFDQEYHYFSSYSKSWLKHAAQYVNYMIERFRLNADSSIIEIASNDGYLLQYFLQKNIPVLGIEPTSNTAQEAINKGIPTIIEFFGTALANKLKIENKKADLLLGNNVLAHVPDITDFVAGMKILLSEKGIITMEFPHLLQLIESNQFDTIYHEHFSYLSLYTVREIFLSSGLTIFDVEELTTHGGSLRIFACHKENAELSITKNVPDILEKEKKYGITDIQYYQNFQAKAFAVKIALLEFLTKAKKENKIVAGYGAAAKGNTLLNYCGIKSDLISFVADANPHKQGKYLPGSHIPVVSEVYLKDNKPDYVIIFPWNLQQEIMTQLSYISEWGGKFVIPIPTLKIM